MSFLDGVHYSIGLRAKAGELEALTMIRPDVADRILPRLILPPPKSEDEGQLCLFDDRGGLNFQRLLGSVWAYRPALVDVTFVMDHFGRDRLSEWFAPALKSARQTGFPLVPCLKVSDLDASTVVGFADCVRASEGFFCLLVGMEEAFDVEGLTQFKLLAASEGVDFSKCVVVVDFTGAEFGNPESVSPILVSAVESLKAVGVWHSIILQGSNYPSKAIPAKENQSILVNRGEWLSFVESELHQTVLGENVLFGDFGADHGEIEFRKGAARAYPYLRYAIDGAWIIVRGGNEGDWSTEMRKVASAIIELDDFDGVGFSKADLRISQIASNMVSQGGPSHWRALNMARHMSKVVADIGRLKGFEIVREEEFSIPLQSGFDKF